MQTLSLVTGLISSLKTFFFLKLNPNTFHHNFSVNQFIFTVKYRNIASQNSDAVKQTPT